MKERALKFYVLMFVMFLAGLVAGYTASSSEYEREISALEGQIIQKDEQVRLLQEWLNSNVTAYSAQISDLQSRLEIDILGVYFSPRGGCEGEIIKWIEMANESIHILIYSFTLGSISDSLIKAHNRGVDVRIVFEKDQISQYSEYWKLKGAGVLVRNDTNSYSMHNKVMIIDGALVFTGSYNWSKTAEERNNENLIIIKSSRVAAIYEEEFEEIWGESV